MTEDAKKIADVLQKQRLAQRQYWRPVFAVMCAVVLILAVGFSILWLQSGTDGRRIDGLEKQNAGSQQTIAAVANDAAAARKAAEQANQRLKEAGKPTVSIPSPTTTVVPPPAAPGLTAAQVQAIVSTAIRAYRPTLTPSQVEQIARVTAPKVTRPKDGRTPTTAELQPLVSVAVTTFCGEDRCVGKPGPKGEPGNDAPPVTDERLSALIDASLKAYCAQHNGCVGADSTVPGPAGPAGPTGPQGRGIVSGPTCIGTGPDSYWLTKYSDDTEQRQDGPCRIGVALPTDPPS
jgi:hypothetical protein